MRIPTPQHCSLGLPGVDNYPVHARHLATANPQHCKQAIADLRTGVGLGASLVGYLRAKAYA